jgi:hypothetical protein
VAAPPEQLTAHPPVSQKTLHDLAPPQSTLHDPAHSSKQPPALLQSTVEPAPTIARHVPLTELQSRLQRAPQLAPHAPAELQSTLQSSRHEPLPLSLLLLQSTWHIAALPQSTAQVDIGSHVHPVPEQVPDDVDGFAAVDGGGGAPTEAPGGPADPEDPPQRTQARATMPIAKANARGRRMGMGYHRSRAPCDRASQPVHLRQYCGEC